MFERLFAESGLSLDRLKSLLEVGAAGSIVKAVQGDPVRQSQYSRQIKELENFFRIKLVERDGKGIRFTSNGRELARISRFFLRGLSNFQNGCLSEVQEFRIGAGATFANHFLLPLLAATRAKQSDVNYAFESVDDDEIERRLHDLTLDFGITTTSAISRPLQTVLLGETSLALWVPKALWKTEARTLQDFRNRRLPLALPQRELPPLEMLKKYRAAIACESFAGAQTVLAGQTVASFLPGYLAAPKGCHRLSVPELATLKITYYFAWNPRLLRLNPHAARRRDFLVKSLAARMAA